MRVNWRLLHFIVATFGEVECARQKKVGRETKSIKEIVQILLYDGSSCNEVMMHYNPYPREKSIESIESNSIDLELFP
jgi:hypothetical protein